MVTQVKLGNIVADVQLKEIKNIHLSVYPPDGRVRISAPLHMNLDTIRLFAASKLGWITEQQKKFYHQERETPREYLNRESHYVWGKRYLLEIHETNHSPSVTISHSRIMLNVRPGTLSGRMQAILDEWYRQQLRQTAAPLIAQWEVLMGIQVYHFFVQHMKTKWGSCNPNAHTIRLNTDLARKPQECLEYIIVHEMAHLFEPTHNARFVALMDRFMPNWEKLRKQLNRLPLSHEEWRY